MPLRVAAAAMAMLMPLIFAIITFHAFADFRHRH